MVQLKSYTAADAVAADLLSLPFITAGDVVQVFRTLPQPQNKSRVNVIPEGQTFVHSQCAGLTTQRGRHLSLSSLDSKAPNVVRLVSRFATDFDSHFTFTTGTINFNYAAKAHVDTNHLDGRARVVSLGDFTGGELWVESLGVRDVKWPNWLDFDATKLHRVEPFEGERYSIVYFTHKLTCKVPPALSAELISIGLPLPASASSKRYFVASQPCLRPPGLFRSAVNGSLAAFVEPELRATLSCLNGVLSYDGSDTISDWVALESVICNEEALRVQRSLVGSSVVEILVRGPLPVDASYGPLRALAPSLTALHIEVQIVPEKNSDRRTVLTAFWEALNTDRRRDDRPTLKLFLVTKDDTWFLCRPVSPQHLLRDGTQKENVVPSTINGFSPLKPELAALMCNLAQVRAYGLVLDPFCGTGRISEAVEALDACGQSADVRGSVVSVYDNIWTPCWRAQFDAIVTDPPFGRRERKFDAVGRPGFTPAEMPAQERLAEAYTILDPLFALAQKCLRQGGRLVFTFANYPNLEDAPMPLWESPSAAQRDLRLLEVIPQRWVKGKHVLERLVVIMEKI